LEKLARRFFPRSGRRVRKIGAQMKHGYHPGLGFLHIPKTGGSGIAELGRKLVRAGQPFPCCFEHNWTFAEIRKRYPKMRMTLILRDPLERTISGFNSRLRQGRPTFTSMWKPAEAVAFAQFRDVRHYLDALIADDDWSLSACAYAGRHVIHLRWNYRYYFRSAEAVRKHAGHIALIGRIEETDAFVDALVAEAGIPASACAGLYERRHEAKVRPSRVLAEYGDGDIARMRARLATEYAIYDALVALGREPRVSGAVAAA
jgi:hypothetical protein